MSWDCPVFPIDAKNSIGFLVQFFLSYAPLVGDSEKGNIFPASVFTGGQQTLWLVEIIYIIQ